ncbi:MAG: polysaccharide deacetylase family protein [Candidatus Lustribacter sp.]|jgi:peptidoglycan/xylan/chitin deacetylase (PgdA/CDA1 family)
MRLWWLFALMSVMPVGANAAAPAGGVPVLMYHMVDPVTPPGPVGRSLTLEPAVFEAQLKWLRAHAIRTLTMNDLADALRRGEHPVNAVVLTFDDGYTDSATVVTPLLLKYGDRGSFYVSAGFIGDGRHASWSQLRAMRAAGMEIGCHGTRHLDLSRIGRSGAAHEVDHCVAALTHYLARPTTYAYPAGRWDAYTLTLMRRAGIKAALTERPGVVTSLAAPYTLPRRRIDRSAGLASFAVLARP